MPKHSTKKKAITEADVRRYEELQHLKWRQKHMAEKIIERMAGNLPAGVDPSKELIAGMIAAANKMAKQIVDHQRKKIEGGARRGPAVY